MALIRRVNPEFDSEAILEIYKPFILHTAITFELQVPDLDAFTSRITVLSQNHPYIVCEHEGKIAGFAYATIFRERSAYDWCKELSVYCHPDFKQKGVATSLYLAVIDVLKHQNITKVIGGIALPNEPSVAFHEKLGFKHVGTFEKVGLKFGKWWAVGFWDLEIGSGVHEIKPLNVLSRTVWSDVFGVARERLMF